MKIRTLGATAVLVLTLGACGGGDDSEASKAIADSMMESNTEGETFQVTQDQADCVGEGLVDEIGTDKIIEYGVLSEELETTEDGIEQVEMSDEDAESAADVMMECADIKEIFTGEMGELPQEAQTCIDEKLTDDVLHEFLVAVFKNDQEGGTQNLMTALTECMGAGG